MIALLTGQVAAKGTDHVILDVAGVGYRVLIPLSTFYALPDEGSVRLHTYTHVREDALLLYGFLTAEEKALFVLLLSVSGVGPKLALNILSHASPLDLRSALAGGDVKRLSTLPGIGKKSAERLVLELKEKIGKLEALPGPAAQSSSRMAATTRDQAEDALSALLNLGYKEAQARRALEAVEIAADTPLETILKNALKTLMR